MTYRPGASSAHKNPAVVATTANITLSGAQIIDGVAVAAGDRVLVKNQTVGSQNGIYVAAAGAWARAKDADQNEEVRANIQLAVSEGTTQADTLWELTTNNPIVVGTTALVFTQIVGGSSTPDGRDYALLTELTSIADVATRYFGSAGNDTTGDGSLLAPYREMQRCLDAIPPGCEGSLNFIALDAGPFKGFSAHDLQAGVESLVVSFIGAGSSVLNIPALPVGTRDVNGAGGNKMGHWRHSSVGAHPALTAASHWLKGAFDAGGGNYWYVGQILDHANSPSPDISIVSEFDYSTFGYDSFDIVPYTSVLAGADYYGSFLLHSVPQRNGSLITLLGFTTTEYLIVQGSNIYLDAVANTDPTKTTTIIVDQPNGTFEQHSVHIAGRTFLKGVEGAALGIAGLFYKTVDISYVSCHLNGACRAVAADVYSIAIGRYGELGVHGGAQLTPNVDFEGNVNTNIYCRRGELRLYDDGSQPTTDGTATHFIYAEHASQVLARDDGLPCVMGSTTGVCVTLSTYSHSRGLLGHGSAPALRNTGAPGSDVTIGSVGVSAAFSSLPATDVGEPVPQFCRAA